ncbi:MAG: BglII/BstYI family type II restriction endonuclease [Bacillota bacterium]
MRKVYEYSHLGGAEILECRFHDVAVDIDAAIRGVDAEAARTKVSQEKTMPGALLYSPHELNAAFRRELSARGFHEVRDQYVIEVPGLGTRIPGAFKQVDFVRDQVFVEVQFGKYAFMFYDLAKFQYFYNQGRAVVGVEIVPCHRLQSQMSTGVSYGEQLIYDIERLQRHFPAVPLKIILIDA